MVNRGRSKSDLEDLLLRKLSVYYIERESILSATPGKRNYTLGWIDGKIDAIKELMHELGYKIPKRKV